MAADAALQIELFLWRLGPWNLDASVVTGPMKLMLSLWWPGPVGPELLRWWLGPMELCVCCLDSVEVQSLWCLYTETRLGNVFFIHESVTLNSFTPVKYVIC